MFNDGINKSFDGDKPNAFLLIGQSNMAGRGDIGDVPPIKNKECYMLRMGRWQPMNEPINPDRAIFEGRFRSGVGLAASFADEFTKKYSAPVGLIPCADGGTRIDQWMPGELLFDHAVMCTRLAMRTSTLRGILWHQGESDCHADDTLLSYPEKLITFVSALRRELDCDVPFIFGELSEDIGKAWGLEDRPSKINAYFRELTSKIKNSALVSVKGLTLKPDGIHFDSPSLRELGKRYFKAYTELL